MVGRIIVQVCFLFALCGVSVTPGYENCTDGIIAAIGTGYCDLENNNEGCMFDGGDCCQCTSINSGSFYSDISSLSLFCVDPSSPCYSPTAATLQSSCTDGVIEYIATGICTEENNNEGCLYDGGDCCQCTSIDDGSFYSDISSSSLFCVDPSSPCYSRTAAALQTNCSDGDIKDVGDGWCDVENNNEGCTFDGGDCCSCTCVTYNCGSSGFRCLDPEFADLDPYVCEKTQQTLATCDELQREWVVENVADVTALAEAVHCSGGYFNVTLKGKVSVDKTISIFDGTVVNVTGINTDSTLDGGGKIRLFSVVNASLHLSNITLSNGSATYGGAIAASRSRTSFAWSTFSGHKATNAGGALHLSNGTSVSFTGETFFLNNTASYGGAIFMMAGSSALWTGNTHFSYNIARSKGGALQLMNHSSSVWTKEALFLYNSAEDDGGALCISSNSSAIWSAKVRFLHNSAERDGGVLCLTDSSSADWTEKAHFLYNSAGDDGGALYLTDGSSADWTAEAHFLYNSAKSAGGALYLLESKVDWTAEAQFLYNSAGSSGGALFLDTSSSADWTAEAKFLNNSAESYGGALRLIDSSAGWTAEAHFLDNSAVRSGGALYLYSSSADWTAGVRFLNNSANDHGGALCLLRSNAFWTAEVYFLKNSAETDGGALYVAENSSASWREKTFPFNNTSNGRKGEALEVSGIKKANWTALCIFQGNSALSNGGGVYAGYYSSLSWSIRTFFLDNTARNGGGIFLSNTVNARWTGETNFTSNYARLNGGAVGLISANDEGSVMAINGPTSFVNNKCGVNGGAMSLVNPLAVILAGKYIMFLRNSAAASGGAVYTAFAGIGIVFTEVDFVENVAQLGGGVHSTGSGTEVTVDKDNGQMNNPMMFDRCNFVGNYAFAIGGAVDSASGHDAFVHTSFEDNEARVGGALRLGGIASIDNCSFEENVSELGAGPAVSNIGYISNVINSYFYHNVFKCEVQTFLHFNQLDNPYETVCDGCPSTCIGCSFGEGQRSPMCISLSEAGVKHATSKGGNTTVEELLIHKGYWRATNTSTNILRCFNTKACKGGLTGASDYCVIGYEGPYCSVCSKNYVSTKRFTCRECSDRTSVIVTATVLIALALMVVIALVSYMVSTEKIGARREIVDHVKERVPLQSVKIIIIVWQILTQFTSVTNVNFPNVYQKFLDGVNFLNFDLSWLLSAGCLLDVDFHDRLLWTTITPLVIMGLLGITYAIAVHRNLGSPETSIRHIQHKHVSMALLVTFLVYSSVSSVVFEMFACDDLDDGKRYLRADYTIDCDSLKHRVLQTYSGFMILLYPVGIPVFYAGMLFVNRNMLRDEVNRERSPIVRSISIIWKPYKPERYYYEVIECARRIMLTGVIVFIFPNSAAQVAATFAIAVVFIFVSEGVAPYKSPWDAWTSRMAQAIIFASMYLALLLKVNVSGENDGSQKMFEVILVACHGCMVFAAVTQAVIMGLWLRGGRHQEDTRPRLRRPANLKLIVESYLVENDNDGKDELSPGLVEQDDVSNDSESQ